MRQSIFPLVLSLVTLSAPMACAQSEQSEAYDEFQKGLTNNGSVTFRSWEGKAYRSDSDTEITFYPNGIVHMFEWGFSLESYEGTYRFESGTLITVQYPKFGQNWPDMILARDETSLLLRPANPKVTFIMGNRGGATLRAPSKNFWPFRRLAGEEEAKVLAMINEYMTSPPHNKGMQRTPSGAGAR